MNSILENAKKQRQVVNALLRFKHNKSDVMQFISDLDNAYTKEELIAMKSGLDMLINTFKNNVQQKPLEGYES